MTRVLVVDDSPICREMLAETLLELDCHVDQAENGAVALSMVSTEAYDLLITDLEMPVMDGFRLIEEVSRAHPSIRIAAVSGMDTTEQRDPFEDARKLGALLTLDKPASSREVRMLLRLAMAGAPAAQG